MALFTKCILAEPDHGDGIRVSVMSRHTLSDGVTPDERIKNFDTHLPILGPSPKLIRDYYKRSLSWNHFELRYKEEMKGENQKIMVEILAKLAMFANVTIMCIEETPEHCHRRLLAELCQTNSPQLVVIHR